MKEIPVAGNYTVNDNQLRFRTDHDEQCRENFSPRKQGQMFPDERFELISAVLPN